MSIKNDSLELFAEVILPLSLSGTFTYSIPESLKSTIQIGQRVIVPVRTSKLYTGLILSIHQNKPDSYQTKNIEEILDLNPVINHTHLEYWKWISAYYLCNLGEVFAAALPSVLRPQSSSKIKFNIDINKEYLNFEWEHLDEDEQELIKVMSTIEDGKNLDELKNIIGKSKLSNLLSKGIFIVEEVLKEHEKPIKETFVQLNSKYKNEQEFIELINTLEHKNPKHLDIILYFLSLSKKDGKTYSPVSKKKLLQNKNLSISSYNTLLKNKILVQEIIDIDRLQIEKNNSIKIDLSFNQQEVYNSIATNFKKFKIGLINGITGSGKTEIYCKLIDKELSKGNSCLFLLPEIALTQQLITRLKIIFGESVLVYHSRINEQQRAEIYKKVFSSTIPLLVLGARSSIFLPFAKLGLVIIDEEHDSSYKQHEPSPRYNARDCAIYLAHIFNANVLLGSATPSIETLYNCSNGKYFRVDLNTRFGNSILPHIVLVDLLKQKYQINTPKYLTEELVNSIKNAVKNKEQVLLFQNRRGFSPLLICESCGWVPYCINCDVSLNYHKSINVIRCHYCGYYETPPNSCKKCGSTRISMQGFGTEKVEEDLSLLMPELRIARFDLDSTRSKFSYNKIVNEFEAGNIDVLVGTQMLSKGLDFSNISLVGILNADSLLHFPDYRTIEKAFQMMVQVSGRAGRRKKQGTVIIQTYNTKNPIFDYILNSTNIDDFYSWQLSERKQFNYPPFTKLIKISVLHKDKQEVEYGANELCSYLKTTFANNVLGPEFPFIQKIRNNYHMQMLLKWEKNKSFSQAKIALKEIVLLFEKNSSIKGIRVILDVDP
jgi:primosomal protein N' (replication factor Y) (superfamily II helicase)